MSLYAHVKGGKIIEVNGQEGYDATHPSVKHLWQKLPDREPPEGREVAWQSGDAAPEGMADAPPVYPGLPIGEFLACWTPEELLDLYGAENIEGSDPIIADLAYRLRAHAGSNIAIDRNSQVIQDALQRMTEVEVPGAPLKDGKGKAKASGRRYLTPERRDQIMAAIRQ